MLLKFIRIIFLFVIIALGSNFVSATSIQSIASQIRLHNQNVIPECSDEDLVYSYTLVDSAKDEIIQQLLGKQKLELHQKTPKCLALARCIRSSINGKSLWQNFLVNVDELAAAICSMKPDLIKNTVEGVIFIFKSFDSLIKQEKLFNSDEERELYCQYEVERFLKHINMRDHVSDIDSLTKIQSSSFHFVKDIGNLQSVEDKLMLNLLANIKGFDIEKRENGICLIAYSVLPHLSGEDFLGSTILQLNELPHCIAIRRFQLANQGCYLTNTVRLIFSIEQSTNGNLLRFRLKTAFPCQQVIFNKYTNHFVDYFPESAKMAACQKQTLQILPELLQMRIGARGKIAQNLVTVSNERPYTLDTFIFQLVQQRILEMQLQASKLSMKLIELPSEVEKVSKQIEQFCEEAKYISSQLRQAKGVANKSIPNAEIQLNQFYEELAQHRAQAQQLSAEQKQKRQLIAKVLAQLKEQVELHVTEVKTALETITEVSKLNDLIGVAYSDYIKLVKQLFEIFPERFNELVAKQKESEVRLNGAEVLKDDEIQQIQVAVATNCQ